MNIREYFPAEWHSYFDPLIEITVAQQSDGQPRFSAGGSDVGFVSDV